MNSTATPAEASDADGHAAPWWGEAVIYEIYPRSFADADGDGVGDLDGITARIPHLAELGVQGLWLTPVQLSPQVDQGYDIADYCAVDPLFGDIDGFDRLLARAHEAGLRVLIDLVPNHTSTRSVLFRRAVEAGPGSPERRLFHFRPGGDGARPNNWVSVFGGPAWSRDPAQEADDPDWYLHLFSPGQPDWNWDEPAVGDMFEGVLRFWFDRGVDGARIDVAHGLFKAPGLPDSPTVPVKVDGLRSNPLMMDQEPVHAVYRRWRRIAASYEPERLLVGEVNLDPERAARYTRPDELHQSFAFAFAQLGWSAQAWADAGTRLERARREHGATVTWALENHDIVRTATRFGGGGRGRRRAVAAATAMLGLPGAVYLFQGQELALPEADVPVAQRRDPMWARGGVSRDGVRVPLPWHRDAAGAHGFSARADATPWLPVPEGWGELSVDAQRQDPASPLCRVRAAVRTRGALLAQGVLRPAAGSTWRLHPGDLVECARTDGVSVLLAMGDAPVPLPDGEILLSSHDLTDGRIPPDTAVWLLRPGRRDDDGMMTRHDDADGPERTDGPDRKDRPAEGHAER